MEPRRRFRFVALAIGGILLFAAGCRSSHDTRPAAPSDQGEAKATTCPPLKVDRATSGLWVQVLQEFIAAHPVQQGCVLVRDGECYQDLPASVVSDLRERVPAASSWSFQCGTGVTVLTLKDESASGHESITVGDGFNASCRWTIRRTWYPGQSRLKSEGCTSVQGR